jgi:hypothetical protein
MYHGFVKRKNNARIPHKVCRVLAFCHLWRYIIPLSKRNTRKSEMSKSQVQIRGICQCCGNEQAVVNGSMSKHGYTVKNGWFNGVCSGERYAPMQVSRDQADWIIAQVRADVAEIWVIVRKLEAGEIKPVSIKKGRMVEGKWVNVEVPFAECPSWDQESAVKSAIWNNEQRAKMGESFANALSNRADLYFGKDLVEVAKPQAAAKIQKGEVRIAENGLRMVAEYQDGARVYYKYQRDNGQVFKAWLGSKAWRMRQLGE